MPLVRHKIKHYDYNEGDMEGTIASDSGAQIRDGIKSVAKLGGHAVLAVGYDDA